MAANSVAHCPVVCIEHQLPSALMYYLPTSLPPDTKTHLVESGKAFPVCDIPG